MPKPKVLLARVTGLFHGRPFDLPAGHCEGHPDMLEHLQALGVPLIEKAQYAEMMRQQNRLDTDIVQALLELEAEEKPTEPGSSDVEHKPEKWEE